LKGRGFSHAVSTTKSIAALAAEEHVFETDSLPVWTLSEGVAPNPAL
jgi:hypothetical protein